jgi:alkanesulfonate monooxygenase SsuD/methylene tetrahydromethanopterin reductase-like flavin-dependent oxidoreductase (luciferase family)
MACSRREAIVEAAQRGLGALSFSFIEPEAAREWVDAYYAALQSEQCVPAGFAVNPTVAVVVPLLCHEDEQTAIERGINGAHFFGFSLAYYYFFGRHRPGRTNLWEEFLANRRAHGFTREVITATDAPLTMTVLQETIGSLRGAIGTPSQITDLITRYERAGVDQVIFAAQAGRTRHEHICESLDLFARAVMPRFAAEADAREAAKRDRLAAACERALARRAPARDARDGYTVTSQGEGPIPS